jgi:glycosyltransferase involved in cell wall biosynthesis
VTEVVVLTNVTRIDGNPYLRLWNDAAQRSGARMLPLTRSAVLASGADRPDWVHLQWPERALRSPRSGPAARAVARMIGLVAIARLRGARVMVTAHNVWSHERAHPRLEPVMWGALGLLSTDLHLLSEAGTAEFLAAHRSFGRAKRHVIPHGNYVPVVPSSPSQGVARVELDIPPDAKVVLTFGLLRGYKGVADLLAAFAVLDDPGAVLLVAGRAPDERLARELDAVADERVRVFPRFLDDAELVRCIRAADWVVLPYRQVLNSGSALMALTLGRPVLLPSTPSFAGLRDDVGGKWVRLLDGPVTTHALAQLERRRGDERPDLSWCSWDRIEQRLAELWPAGARA